MTTAQAPLLPPHLAGRALDQVDPGRDRQRNLNAGQDQDRRLAAITQVAPTAPVTVRLLDCRVAISVEPRTRSSRRHGGGVAGAFPRACPVGPVASRRRRNSHNGTVRVTQTVVADRTEQQSLDADMVAGAQNERRRPSGPFDQHWTEGPSSDSSAQPGCGCTCPNSRASARSIPPCSAVRPGTPCRVRRESSPSPPSPRRRRGGHTVELRPPGHSPRPSSAPPARQ